MQGNPYAKISHGTEANDAGPRPHEYNNWASDLKQAVQITSPPSDLPLTMANRRPSTVGGGGDAEG